VKNIIFVLKLKTWRSAPEKSATAWRKSVVGLLDSHSAVADFHAYECI
jgi:hypothetical protein